MDVKICRTPPYPLHECCVNEETDKRIIEGEEERFVPLERIYMDPKTYKFKFVNKIQRVYDLVTLDVNKMIKDDKAPAKEEHQYKAWVVGESLRYIG